MYLERLLPENVRHLAPVEEVFSDGPQQIRRWTLLSAGAAATARLRCLALISLGRWQMSRLAGRVRPLLAAHLDRPVQVEFVLIRHAPQERQPHSPSRHQQGWRLLAGGRWEALARQTLRCQVPGARQGGAESGRSQTARLLLGYGRSPQAGADGFGLDPDQRWRRCAGLFDAEPRLTDPVAFLKRLHHKSQYRDGRARMVLDRLKDGLSDWLGWDVAQSLERGDLEAHWKSTPRARQVPALVALDIARHAFDAAGHLGETDPLRQPGVVLFERMQAWCPARRQAAFVGLLDGWFPNLQFILALDAGARRRFPRRLLRQRLPIPEPQPRPALAAPRRLPRGAVLLVDLDSRLPNLALMKLSRHFKAELLVLGVAGEFDDIEPVEERRRNAREEVGRRDEEDFGEVERNAEVVIRERVVLRRIEHLEKGARGVALEGHAQLVDLVEEEDGVLRPSLLQALDDAAGHRADVCAPVATDVGFVARAAKRDADVLATHRARDGLRDRGLPDAGRADEEEDPPLAGRGVLFRRGLGALGRRSYRGALGLRAHLAHREELEDAVLHVGERVVVLVEKIGRASCRERV